MTLHSTAFAAPAAPTAPVETRTLPEMVTQLPGEPLRLTIPNLDNVTQQSTPVANRALHALFSQMLKQTQEREVLAQPLPFLATATPNTSLIYSVVSRFIAVAPNDRTPPAWEKVLDVANSNVMPFFSALPQFRLAQPTVPQQVASPAAPSPEPVPPPAQANISPAIPPPDIPPQKKPAVKQAAKKEMPAKRASREEPKRKKTTQARRTPEKKPDKKELAKRAKSERVASLASLEKPRLDPIPLAPPEPAALSPQALEKLANVTPPSETAMEIPPEAAKESAGASFSIVKLFDQLFGGESSATPANEPGEHYAGVGGEALSPVLVEATPDSNAIDVPVAVVANAEPIAPKRRKNAKAEASQPLPWLDTTPAVAVQLQESDADDDSPRPKLQTPRNLARLGVRPQKSAKIKTPPTPQPQQIAAAAQPEKPDDLTHLPWMDYMRPDEATPPASAAESNTLGRTELPTRQDAAATAKAEPQSDGSGGASENATASPFDFIADLFSAGDRDPKQPSEQMIAAVANGDTTALAQLESPRPSIRYAGNKPEDLAALAPAAGGDPAADLTDTVLVPSTPTEPSAVNAPLPPLPPAANQPAPPPPPSAATQTPAAPAAAAPPTPPAPPAPAAKIDPEKEEMMRAAPPPPAPPGAETQAAQNASAPPPPPSAPEEKPDSVPPAPPPPPAPTPVAQSPFGPPSSATNASAPEVIKAAEKPPELPPEPKAEPPKVAEKAPEPPPQASTKESRGKKAAKPKRTARNLLREEDQRTQSRRRESASELLEKLPQQIEAMETGKPKTPAKTFVIDRVKTTREIFDPTNDMESQNAKHESMGVKIEVKTPRIDLNFELEKAYNALMAGQSTVAMEIYRNVLEADPNNVLALFGMATSYHRNGQFEQARSLYAKILTIDPDNRDALNNFLALVSNEAPQESLQQLEQLEARNPEFSPIPAQMAVIYQRLGNQEKAMQKMLRAVSLEPENLTYRYNLAVLMDRQGKREEAATLYRQLLTAYEKGATIPGDRQKIQERLTFLGSNPR